MKRFLSLLLVFLMCFSITFSTSAFATDDVLGTEAHAESSAADSGAPDSDTATGSNTLGGNTLSGNTPDSGAAESGNATNANPPDSNAPVGNTPDANAPGGNTPDSGNTPGSNTTIPSAADTLQPIPPESNMLYMRSDNQPGNTQPDDEARDYPDGPLTVTPRLEFINNPYIVASNSPNILLGVIPTGTVIFTDKVTGMPAYCLDHDRDNPSPNSLYGDEPLDPETIFDPVTYSGIQCLLLAGYPYSTGNGLTKSEAHACTQVALWYWIYESTGRGLNASGYKAIPGKEHVYDYFISLMDVARNHKRPDYSLSATDVHMTKSGDTLTGQSTVTLRNLNGGYSLDKSKLPEGITVSGYTGSTGDVLTFTAPLSFAGKSIVLKDLLFGHDERSVQNLFWYDNKNPKQQRMTIAVKDTAKVALQTGIAMDFDDDVDGRLKLVKRSSSDNTPLSGAVYGVFDKDTDMLICELTTDNNGEAYATLREGNYYLLELKAPEGYELSSDRIAFSISSIEENILTVTDDPIKPNTPGTPDITVPKTGEIPPYGNYILASICLGLAALCGAMLYHKRKQSV